MVTFSREVSEQSLGMVGVCGQSHGRVTIPYEGAHCSSL